MKKMLKLNIDATEQRYTTPYLNPKEKKERIKSFRFGLVDALPIQALKSLHCYSYQCSEGNIPNKKLYKLLEKLSKDIATHIIDEMPEYDKAEWG